MKLENILIEGDLAESDILNIKLIDFGTSELFHRDDKYHIYTRGERRKLQNWFNKRIGTVAYMSNEVLGKSKDK